MKHLVLMSIRPRFAKVIYSGAKQHEFRRTRVNLHKGDRVLIYESAPVSLVTGEFGVGNVSWGSPSELLSHERNSEARTDAYRYLFGASLATSIKIMKPLQWKRPRKLGELLPTCHPPQSYCFVE